MEMALADAEKVLEKYGLKEKAEKEFQQKAGNKIPMDVPLRLKIRASCLDSVIQEIRNKRESVLANYEEKCPHFNLARQRNRYAHDTCKFLCQFESQDFCASCDFYLNQVKKFDLEIEELLEAAKCFRLWASIDNTLV